VTEPRDDLADALLASFGGRFQLSRGRALKHADFLLAAGFARPRLLRSEAEAVELADSAVVERFLPGKGSEFFVKRDGVWINIDGGDAVSDAGLGDPDATLSVRRA
jgi:hypothetical protein